MTAAVRALAALPPRRVAGIARTSVLAVGVEVALRLFRLPRVCAALGVRSQSVDTAGERPRTGEPEAGELELSDREIERIADVRTVLRRRAFNGTCLRQALLVGHVLRHRDPVLRLGVKKSDGRVRAHAWVDVDGWTIDDFAVHRPGGTGFDVLELERT